MKKILTIVFVFSVSLSWAQIPEGVDKHFFVGTGFHNNWQFRKSFSPAFEPIYFPYQWAMETKYPGRFRYGTYGYHLNLFYEFPIKYGIYISPGIFIGDTYHKYSRSEDSIRAFYVYPDSLLNILDPQYTDIPKVEKINRKHVEIRLNSGYTYKRFSIGLGIYYNLLDYKTTKREYIDYKTIERDLGFLYQDFYPWRFEVTLKCRITSGKRPLWMYFNYSHEYMLGLLMQV